MTQTETLLNRLKSGPVDPMTALRELGIYRLSARVNDLRNSGIAVKTTIKKVGKHRVAEYSL